MKYTLALAAVLAAVAVVCKSSVIKAEPRSNLSIGFVTIGDRHLYREFVYRAPAPNVAQYEDVTWRGNASTVISCIQATELGAVQTAAAWPTAGGLGCNFTTIRFHAYGSLGYNYVLDIYGH